MCRWAVRHRVSDHPFVRAKIQSDSTLLTSDEFKRYYKVENFEIDRSATDKDVMKDKLKKQWNKTQDWGKVYAETTDETISFYRIPLSA